MTEDVTMSKRQERQRFIRYYKDETGEREIDMHKVAEYAKRSDRLHRLDELGSNLFVGHGSSLLTGGPFKRRPMCRITQFTDTEPGVIVPLAERDQIR